MSVGIRLRKFGNDRFGSVKKFAEELGMQPPALQAYLNGSRKPGTEILQKLNLMGCDINWLLTGKKMEYTNSGFNNYVSDFREKLHDLTEMENLRNENDELRKKNIQLEKDLEAINKILNRS